LYDKNNKPQDEDMHLETDTEYDVKGPRILFSEFEAAFSELKNGKAEGKDGILGELGVKGKRGYMISAMKYMLQVNCQMTFWIQ